MCRPHHLRKKHPKLYAKFPQPPMPSYDLSDRTSKAKLEPKIRKNTTTPRQSQKTGTCLHKIFASKKQRLAETLQTIFIEEGKQEQKQSEDTS